MRRSCRPLMLLIVGLVTLTACGSGASIKSSEQSIGEGMATVTPSAPMNGAPPMQFPVAPQPTASVSDRAPEPLPPGYAGSVTTFDRKVIMNGEIQVKVKSVEDALAKITSSVSQSGGYIQETRQEGVRQSGRTVYVTMRVPAERYTALTSLIGGLGEDPVTKEWTADVTAEYLDLDARMKTREVHLAQLQKLYDKGTTIKELMELEAEIARVTADLESLKGRFRYLSNQVAYSTISAKLYETSAPTPIQPPKGVLERMEREFLNSWNQVVNFTGTFLVFLVSVIPVIAYVAVLGGVAYAIYRTVRRGRRGPPSA